MQLPAIAFGIAALTVMLLPKRRPSAGAWLALGRMLAVSLPLWLVMAPIRPSQPDTFLNLLPNAFYLVDYGLLPTAARPPSLFAVAGRPLQHAVLEFSRLVARRRLSRPGHVAGQCHAPARGRPRDCPRTRSRRRLRRKGRRAGGSRRSAFCWRRYSTRVSCRAFILPPMASRRSPQWRSLPLGSSYWRKASWLEGNRPAQLLPLALALAAIANTKQTGIALVAALAGAALISGWAERSGAARGGAEGHGAGSLACAVPFCDLAVSRRPCGGRRADNCCLLAIGTGPISPTRRRAFSASYRKNHSTSAASPLRSWPCRWCGGGRVGRPPLDF